MLNQETNKSEINEQQLQDYLNRFVLVEGTRIILDKNTSTVLIRASLTKMIGNQYFGAWSKHPKRQLITYADLNKMGISERHILSFRNPETGEDIPLNHDK